jgi:hypothetical protein
VSNVVLTASGADVAGKEASLLVAGGGGDLGGVVAVSGRQHRTFVEVKCYDGPRTSQIP